MNPKQVLLGMISCFLLQAHTALSDSFDVPETLWNSLSTSEKVQVSNSLELNLVSSTLIGIIVNVQTLDQSRPGTVGGSYLGSAYGSAAYIDKAFSGNAIDYSAKKHLGVSLLGSVLGASLDKSPVFNLKTRYTIALQDGSIQHIEEQTANQFTHTVGLCVFLNPLKVVNQKLCSMTKADLLTAAEHKKNTQLLNELPKPIIEQSAPASEDGKSVRCKIGENPVTLLPKSTCVSLGGLIDAG